MNNRHFPLFIESKNKNVLVIGGGNIALRRVTTLIEFDFNITIVSKSVLPELAQLIETHHLTHIDDRYKPEYMKDEYDIILACTDNREINNAIGNDAKAKEKLVSVCDAREECNFYFPAVAVNDSLTMGLAGDGSDHKATRRAAAALRKIIKERLY